MEPPVLASNHAHGGIKTTSLPKKVWASQEYRSRGQASAANLDAVEPPQPSGGVQRQLGSRVHSFVTAVRDRRNVEPPQQDVDIGVDICLYLSRQSDEINTKRRHYVEERAITYYRRARVLPSGAAAELSRRCEARRA